MPFASKKPCRKQGCPELVDSGYCDSHKVTAHAADRLHRGASSERGYDHAWSKVRLLALKRDKFLCIDCLASNRVTSAVDVHHIMKVATHQALRLVLTNLKSLCRACHAVYTARGE